MRRRGAILIVCYLLVAVILAFGSATMVRSAVEQRTVARYGGVAQAFQLAESGLDLAIIQLRLGNISPIDPAAFAQGTYQATITQPSPLGQDQYLIQAIGQTGGLNQSVEAVVQSRLTWPFQWGLFGIQRVDIDGSVETDSYNSAKGTYAATRGTNGDVGTSSIGAETMRIRGSARINGDTLVGLGGDPDAVIRIDGAAVITGKRQAAAKATTFATLNPPANCAAYADLDGDGVLEDKDLKTTQGLLALPEGTYCYSGIQLESGSSAIRGSGAVTIYVSGAVDFRGQAIAASSDLPPQLTINVSGQEDVDLEGASTIYAAIYAPNARVRIRGSAVLYGAVVAKEFRLEGSAAVHYDEALTDGASPGAMYDVQMVSWRAP